MSDYLAFMTSPLQEKLQHPGFLAPGLVLFGDSAYINAAYMATPFKGVSSGPEDAYNFYHSQLRIKIECSFGMLVHRWGILRKPIPYNITIKKTSALVLCLCKLHNYCIDMKESAQAAENTAADTLEISSNGGVPLDDPNGNPSQLLHAGHHFEDFNRALRAQIDRHQPDYLPRDYLLSIVEERDLRRPDPQRRL
jgi:hypothetical protein